MARRVGRYRSNPWLVSDIKQPDPMMVEINITPREQEWYLPVLQATGEPRIDMAIHALLNELVVQANGGDVNYLRDQQKALRLARAYVKTVDAAFRGLFNEANARAEAGIAKLMLERGIDHEDS